MEAKLQHFVRTGNLDSLRLEAEQIRRRELESLLFLASQHKNPEILEFLLTSCDLTVDARQPLTGWTPLHHAVNCNRVENTRTLLKCGADVTVPDNGGVTPLRIAKDLKRRNIGREFADHLAVLEEEVLEKRIGDVLKVN